MGGKGGGEWERQDERVLMKYFYTAWKWMKILFQLYGGGLCIYLFFLSVIFVSAHPHCRSRSWVCLADSVEADQPAHTFSLILFCTLSYYIAETCQRNRHPMSSVKLKSICVIINDWNSPGEGLMLAQQSRKMSIHRASILTDFLFVIPCQVL